MELLRFIKWQWNSASGEEIVVTLDTIFTTCVFAYVTITMNVFIAFFISVCAFMAFAALAAIGGLIRKQWRMYKAQQARDAQAIVDKLRGGSR